VEIRSEKEIREKLSELEKKQARFERAIWKAKNPFSAVLFVGITGILEGEIEILKWVLGE